MSRLTTKNWRHTGTAVPPQFFNICCMMCTFIYFKLQSVADPGLTSERQVMAILKQKSMLTAKQLQQKRQRQKRWNWKTCKVVKAMKVEPGIVEFDTTHHNTRVVSCFLCLISSFAFFEFDKRHLFDLFDILALLVATDLPTWIIITLILLTTVMVTSPFLHGLPSLKLTVRT